MEIFGLFVLGCAIFWFAGLSGKKEAKRFLRIANLKGGDYLRAREEDIYLRLQCGHTYEQAARLPGRHLASYRGHDGKRYKVWETLDESGQFIKIEKLEEMPR